LSVASCIFNLTLGSSEVLQKGCHFFAKVTTPLANVSRGYPKLSVNGFAG
jgi:hypothetical protein